MSQQKSFGRRGREGVSRNSSRGQTSRTFHETIDDYEDPVLVRYTAGKPWPAVLSVGLTGAITAGVVYASGEVGPELFYILPLMLLLGGLLYLQFRGLQKGMQGEKRDRAIQARYPLIPITGMIGGLVYFMITKDQSLSDIIAYDWSGMFGLRTDIEAEEPLTATLFNAMAVGGGAGVCVAALWYKASKGATIGNVNSAK